MQHGFEIPLLSAANQHVAHSSHLSIAEEMVMSNEAAICSKGSFFGVFS